MSKFRLQLVCTKINLEIRVKKSCAVAVECFHSGFSLLFYKELKLERNSSFPNNEEA